MPRGRVRKPAEAPERRRVPSDHLSSVAENYLLSLYILREEGVRLTMRQLAEYLKSLPVGERLGTSLPSVAGMVRRMAREGLLELTPNKEIHLTDRGELLAVDMVRRHRLAERMVVDLLGVELHRAHVEAHRLEHAISPELQAKIVERLGNPATCPFGRPIPGGAPKVDGGPTLTLDRAKPGVTYRIDRVPEEDQELLRFLVENRVIPDTQVVVREAAAYRGVLTLDIADQQVALGYQVASRIWVRSSEA